MSKSDTYLQERIKWRAGQHKLPKENAFYFDELSQDQKQKYEDLLRECQIGIPVILFVGKSNKWTIVGTQKVAGCENSNVECMSYSEIEIHTVGDDPFNQFSGSDDYPEKEFKKLEQDHLLMKDKTDKIIKLYTAPGSDVYTLFSIIIMLERMSGQKNWL